MGSDMNASQLLAVLRKHYLPDGRPPGGVFAAEIESPDGKRRADALWMPTTSMGPKHLVGHELKVSRSDVLAELADPTKADAWGRYCGQWWLVVSDPTLVEGLDARIPEEWGVMAPPSGRRTRSMTVLRPAPRLHPADAAPAFRRVAVWLGHRTNDAIANAERDVRYARQETERAVHELQQVRATVGGRIDPRMVALQRVLTRVEAARKDRGLWQEADEDAIVAALVDHVAVSSVATSTRHELEWLVREVRAAADPLARVVRDLERLRAPEPDSKVKELAS